MNKRQAYETVRDRLREWQQALAQVDEVRARFGAAETSGAAIGADAVAEIRRAENRALRQWEELQDAVGRWSGMVLESRPPLQEILKILRANMPALQAEYGVTSLAVIGDYARGDDYEAGRLDLMFEYNRPLGYAFIGLEDDVGDLLGVKVNLLSKSLVKEKYPQLIEGAVPV